ncbi:hypothetical protein H0E87_015815 [Populus deltoides]|uniref:Uncharacterized protein n=1 Tax=Populus deltoides TaxID=3696 RepID=A0A8T2Y6E1_POPDE|nr:hypothetical protein H0E87_015747 [Populus deltoides]KAH8500728.1 hypothetical protein H0E87_015815 [Populus deltoides]
MAGAGSLVNDVKNVNGILPTGNNTVINRGNGLVGNGTINSSGIEGAVYSGQCNQSSNGVGVAAARGRRYSGAKAAIIFLFWILFILAQLGLLIAFGHEETGKLVKSLPRKARFFETRFHAPPSQDQPLDIDKGDPETVYEDDKRIIHTGPNPLHN